MEMLRENPELSQRELADAVGISVGSAHYVINALLEAGLIKFGGSGDGWGRRRGAYLLTPKGLAEQAAAAGRFVARKLEEYEALRDEIARLSLEYGLEGEVPERAGDIREALKLKGRAR